MEILKYINSRCLHWLFFLLAIVVNTALTDVLPSILWATYNPFFRNLGDSPRTVFLKDQLNFVCPNLIDYPVQTSEEYKKELLYANMYMVDKKGFEDCNATRALKKLKDCTDPTNVQHIEVRILETAPTQDMQEFKPGEWHYIVDTSYGTKDNVSNLVGGRCRTHNMKMKLYVCIDQSDPLCPNGNKVTNGGWSSWGECTEPSGTQTRQCNNPVPSNGGHSCLGNQTTPCKILPTPTVGRPNNNDTVTPKKDKRTSVAINALGTLSVGAVVGIFLAIFIFGCVLGLLIGVYAAKIKSKGQINIRRSKGSFIDQFNRSSITSINTKQRPFSTISNDTTLTNVTGFVSYNDIYDEVK